MTFELPMYGVRSTVSVLHCALVGVNDVVTSGAVAKVVPDLLNTDVKVAPQSLETKTSNPSLYVAS